MELEGLSHVLIGPMASQNDDTIDPKDVVILNSETGGPTGFSIKNLSPATEKEYGGDGVFSVSTSGAGDVELTFNALDLPQDLVAKLMGYQKDSTGMWIHGRNSLPIPAAVMGISHHGGKAVFLGMFKGMFARGDVNPETNNEKNNKAHDSLTYTATQNAKGQVYAEGSEGADGVTVANATKLIFGTEIEIPGLNDNDDTAPEVENVSTTDKTATINAK